MHTISLRDSGSISDAELISHSFMDQLRSLAIPSEPQISQLTRCIHEWTSEIHSLDDELSRLRASLNELENIRRCFQRCREQAQGLLAPIRRLPSEILGEIFSFSVGKESYPCLGGGGAPVLYLSQVCHHWREITNSMPELWAGPQWIIQLNARVSTDSTSLISHFLLMSKTASLMLKITDTDPDDDRYARRIPPEHVEALQALLLHSERWESADLHFDGHVWGLVEEALLARPRPIHGYFPRLQTLILHGIEVALTTANIFRPVPSLSSLEVDEIRCLYMFPYSRVKSLRVNSHSLTLDDLDFLRKCGNSELILHLRLFCTTQLQVPLPTYTLTALSALELHTTSHFFSWAFRSLTLPSLTNLFLKSVCHEIKWPSGSFESMIARSGCTLKTLRISYLIFQSKEELRSVFRSLPDLIKLQITLPSQENRPAKIAFSDMLFDLLTIEPSSQLGMESVLLPSLSDLVLSFNLDGESMVDKFVHMVNSRTGRSAHLAPGVSRLRKLQYEIPIPKMGPPPASILDQIQPEWSFMEKGIQHCTI